jgi:serine/threonine-protein kinase
MTKEGIAKVTDFGIARAVSSSTITMCGSTIGSVHYFSPEQARGGFTDEKSDLYSIGIALYEMVTGRVPFDGDTPVAVALKHLQVEAEQPLSINKDLPKGINDIIMKAIEKDQSKRYQSASEMLEDLNKVLKDPFGDFVNCQDTDSCPTRRIQIIKETKSDEKGNDVELSKGKIENEKVKKDRRTWILAIATSVLIMVTFLVITVFVIVPSIVDNKKDKEITLENLYRKRF